MKNIRFLAVFTFILLALFINCEKSAITHSTIKNIIIIVVDGPRYMDLMADTLLDINQPFKSLKEQGLFFSNFYNDGTTNTQNGMSNILTGNGESLTNNGAEISDFPNIFHYYLEAKNISNDKTWIITSKDKLESLKSTMNTNYNFKPTARTNSGINGLNSGYRHDSITHRIALEVLNTFQPTLTFIAYREPDYSGHQGVWDNYKQGIKSSYNYAQEIVNYVQSNSFYRGNTLILITNDHGRHLDTVSVGFSNHGDNCEGCRHISLIAISPNIKKSTVDALHYNQNNIAPTIANILGFSMPTATEKIIPSVQ